MCTIWWIWIYAYTYKAITTIKVINIFSFWFMFIYKTHAWVFETLRDWIILESSRITIHDPLWECVKSNGTLSRKIHVST